MDSVIYKSIITCPSCGFQKEESMPVNSCMFYYECTNCHITLKPEKGDCCVFCSWGSVVCPSVQENNDCCAK